jgi:hypothetical protein
LSSSAAASEDSNRISHSLHDAFFSLNNLSCLGFHTANRQSVRIDLDPACDRTASIRWALQACQCSITRIDGCTDFNDKHPLMTRIRESIKRRSREKILNILRFLNLSLSVPHHPEDVHKIQQLEDYLAMGE